ncbi:MAG: 4Fe-4S binding protein [Holosporaceae bacterium]|jgi:ferredoxin|nr:4Fe-4S binding protein [Holosporaceae bacterium]
MKIIPKKCKRCLACVDVCPVKAISKKGEEVVISSDICLECGCCASFCPNDAIEYE